MDRRAFLRLSGLSAIPVAVPLLSSCTSKTGDAKVDATGSAPPSPAATTGADPNSLQSIVDANTGRLDVINAQAETLVGSKRIAFGLIKDNKPVTDAMVRVYIGQDAGKAPVGEARASWVQGEMAPRALYVADLSLATPGEWLVGVVARLKDGTVYGGGAPVNVLATSTSPVPGQPAISVATPTTATTLDADPLCSDQPGPCPMHAISLDAALRNGKPTLLTFGAPAYCATDTCGPVNRIISSAVPAYGARVNFVHVEAYDKDNPGTLRPVAQAWKLSTEPFTFFIDGKGIVKDRLPGAFGADELTTRLEALSA